MVRLRSPLTSHHSPTIAIFNAAKTIALNQRFYSLDVFRGATVALMILVNNPGNWAHIYAPLKHAPWHGFPPTDLVFPFFLFAVGNALAFVMPRLQLAGTKVFLKKVITRTVLIFLIGLFLNWWPFVSGAAMTWFLNIGSIRRILRTEYEYWVCCKGSPLLIFLHR